MATHGKAREVTINNLQNRKPWQRKGFGMSAVEGKFNGYGCLASEDIARYAGAEVIYTVLSYSTPIAWVTTDGEVVVPEAKYSVTTTHHQSLCKVYL